MNSNINNSDAAFDAPLWVFGYGSLIWNPGFVYLSKQKATLHGYHRSFCIYSHVHRGTEERPGLVLGLDRGGACRGLAYQIAADARDEILAYLREREQITKVYREIIINLRLGSGEKVRALTYVADRTHGQYAGRLSLEQQLELIRHGHGKSGKNPEYLRNTHEHLAILNIHDHTLDWLVHHL